MPLVTLLDYQKLICELGYPILTDGSIGPVTRGAWASLLEDVAQGGTQLRYTLYAPGPSITSAYGPRYLEGYGQHLHTGVDVGAPTGAPVRSAAEGKVISAADHADGWGICVVIEHQGGERTRYAHLSEATVKPGITVKLGDLIGKVGETGRSKGSHLHFQVEDARGVAKNPAGIVGVVW